MAERDIEIPSHIDIYLVSGEAEPSDVNAIDFIVASAKAKVAKLEAYIEALSIADDVDDVALESAYEELEGLAPPCHSFSRFDFKSIQNWTQQHSKPKQPPSFTVSGSPPP